LGGFFAPDGIEMVLLPLAGSIALTLTGPGAYALDGLLARRQVSATSDDPRAVDDGRLASFAAQRRS
jgi:hypothetical protein